MQRQKYVLRELLRVLMRREHARSEAVDPRLVSPQQHAERLEIAGTRALERRGLQQRVGRWRLGAARAVCVRQ